MATVNAADIVAAFRINTGDAKRDADQALGILRDFQSKSKEVDHRLSLFNDPDARTRVGKDGQGLLTGRDRLVGHHGGLDPADDPTKKTTDGMGRLGEATGRANKHLTETERLIRGFGTSRGIDPFINAIGRLGPAAAGALAAAKVMIIGLQAASNAADLYFANQGTNIERQISAQKKFGDMLRNIPIAGELGGAIKDLFEAPARAAMAEMVEATERQNKRIAEVEPRVRERTQGNKAARDMTREVGRAIELLNSAPLDRPVIEARNKLADFNREIQELWERTGGQGMAKLTQDQKTAQATLARNVGEASRQRDRGEHADDVAAADREFQLKSDTEQAKLRIGLRSREAERRALTDDIERRRRAYEEDVSNAEETGDKRKAASLRLHRPAEQENDQAKLDELAARQAREAGEDIIAIENASRQREMQAERRDYDAQQQAIVDHYDALIDKEEDYDKKEVLKESKRRDQRSAEIVHEREMAERLVDIQTSTGESALREIEANYLADQYAFESMWDAKIKKITDATEREAAIEQRAAQRRERDARRQRETQAILLQAQNQNLRNSGNERLASEQELQERTNRSLREAAGDPKRQAAIRALATAQLDALKKGQQSSSFMGDSVDRVNDIQQSILDASRDRGNGGRVIDQFAQDLREGKNPAGANATAKDAQNEAADNLDEAAGKLSDAADKLANIQLVGVVGR